MADNTSDTVDPILEAAAKNAAYILHLEAEVERLTKALSFEKAEWYWDTHDSDTTHDSANDVLHSYVDPLDLVEVAGAIRVGVRWGFYSVEDEDAEPVFHWFATQHEARDARDAMRKQAELPLPVPAPE